MKILIGSVGILIFITMAFAGGSDEHKEENSIPSDPLFYFPLPGVEDDGDGISTQDEIFIFDFGQEENAQIEIIEKEEPLVRT